jgi:signal transduction histidine kinase
MAAALVVLAGVASVTAVAIALRVAPTLDFTLSQRADQIAWVLPGGASWQSGVRSGQRVVSLTFGPTPDNWQLMAADAHGSHAASAAGQTDALRGSLPFAIGGCVASAFAFVGFARHRQLAGALAVAALVLVQPALRLAGFVNASEFLISSTPVLAGLWLAVTTRERGWRYSLYVGIGVAAVWLVARFWAPAMFDVADATLLALSLGAVATSLWVSAPWRRWLATAVSVDPSLAVDLAAVAITLGGAIAASVIFAVPLWLVLTSAATVLAIYPHVRKRLGRVLEEMIFGEMRAHAGIAATEEERARLASEIHDGPLQELAAVISELDEAPDMSAAAHVLRGVAAELRGVTTALRPPVLDDLGLGAAVSFLVDQARGHASAPIIKCAIEDRGQVGVGQRPPREVELAAFRVVQEALGNALSHAGASRIAIEGEISSAAVRLEVADNGTGIDELAIRNARRAGHQGLASMRQRAEAVGGELSIGRQSISGTLVSFSWSPT